MDLLVGVTIACRSGLFSRFFTSSDVDPVPKMLDFLKTAGDSCGQVTVKDGGLL